MLDGGRESAVRPGRGVGVGGDHETGRNPYAGPDQLAEVRALAARGRQVMPADLGQRPHPPLRPVVRDPSSFTVPSLGVDATPGAERDVSRAAAGPAPRPAGSVRCPRCAMRTRAARRRPASPRLQPVRRALDAHGERTLPDQQQVRGRYRVGHRAGAGAAGRHRAVQDLERRQAVRRQQTVGSMRVVAADLGPDRRAISGAGRLGQEVRESDVEDGGQPAQRGHRCAASAAFELGQESFAHAGRGGRLGEGPSPFLTPGPKPRAQAVVEGRVLSNVKLPCVGYR